MVALSIVGIIIALVVLVLMCFKGYNIFLTAIICAVIVAIFGGANIYDTMKDTYMNGMGSFIINWFLLFTIGTIFGQFMQLTGAASSAGYFITRLFGEKGSVLALCLALGIMNYSGINGFVAIFVAYPIMLAVFKKCDISKRFLCGIYFFGVGTWANMGMGSPSGLNAVCTGSLGVSLAAAPIVSLSIQATIIIVGSIWLLAMIKSDKKKGIHFELGDMEDIQEDIDNLPNPILSLVPLAAVIIACNIRKDGVALLKVEQGVLIGIVVCVVLFFKRIDWKKDFKDQIATAFKNGLSMTANTAAVSGFGAVVMASTAYPVIVSGVMNFPGPKLLSLVVAVSVICICTGTATGSASAILPTLGPVYVQMGLDPGVVARIAASAAVGFDSVPHNGTCVAIINDISHETYKTAYGPVFALSVITPLIGTLVGVLVASII